VNIFLRELRANRRSTITWTVSLSTIVVVFMGLYPAFSADVDTTRELLAQFPEALRTALNLSLDNFFTIQGFFGYLLGFAVLAGGIQAMNLGTGIIAKEVSGKTADFLLSKPVTRSTVVTAKLAAALTILVITNVAFALVSYLAARAMASEPFSARTFLLLASTLFLVQLFFLALGSLFAVLLPKVKSVVSVSLPTVFAFYIVAAVGDVVANEDVRYITPFKLFESDYIIANNSLEGSSLALLAGFVVVAIAASYVIYNRKDVRAAA